jgi:hypothetical protein
MQFRAQDSRLDNAAALVGLDARGRLCTAALGDVGDPGCDPVRPTAPAVRRAARRSEDLAASSVFAAALIAAHSFYLIASKDASSSSSSSSSSMSSSLLSPPLVPIFYISPTHAVRDAALAGPHTALALSRHSDVIALGTETGLVVVLDPHARSLHAAVCAKLEAHIRPVTVVAFSPDERLLVTADEAGVIQVWLQHFSL